MSKTLAQLAGDVLGVFGGGRSQVTAAAVTAKISKELQSTREKLLNKTKALGSKLGPRIGSDFFKALEEGAAPTAAAARSEETQARFGYAIDPRDLPTIAKYVGGGALVVLVLILLYKAAK